MGLLPLIRQIHSLADLPVIITTAKDQSDDVVEALRLGANDYVVKPVLLARIQTQLKLKRLSQLKDEFLRIASHDLKNPLSAVLLSAHLLHQAVPPGTKMEPSITRRSRTSLNTVKTCSATYVIFWIFRRRKMAI